MFFGFHICMDEIQMMILALPVIGGAITLAKVYGGRALQRVRSVMS